MKTNILYVHSGDDWIAGSERVFLSLFKSLDRKKVSPFLICDQPSMLNEARKLNVPAKQMPFHFFLQDYNYKDINPISFVRDIFKIYKYAKEWEIDLIHATNGGVSQLCYFVSKLLKIKWLCHVQTLFFKRSRIMGMIPQADQILAISEAVAKDYQNVHDKVRLIYNGVNHLPARKVNKNQVKQELGFNEKDIVIGTVAFLIPRKGVDIFIELANDLKNVPNLKFLIVGKGPLENELKQKVADLKLADQIRFLGHVEDILSLMHGIDIFCLFSRKEPFGLVVIEALSQGVPVIASNIDGIREIFQEGQEGFLVDLKDRNLIKNKTLQLIENKELRDLMGVKGKALIEDKFDYEKRFNEIVAVYDELLNRN